MPVNTRHPALAKLRKQYELVTDAIDGEAAVKARADRYLPRPNAEDESDYNLARYDAYIVRAIFYGVTGRTLRGLVGEVFAREPQIDLPSRLDILKTDVNGLNVGIVQQAKKAVGAGVSVGRAGLFVDYPATGGEVTQDDINSGKVRPSILLYSHEQIINWRYANDSGKRKLTLVVIEEEFADTKDPFVTTRRKRWIELRIDEHGDYVKRTHESNKPVPEFDKPTGADGNPFPDIPFSFIGGDDNDPDPDPVPMYDLASVNMGHYRNSADYEESCFIVGQPTPYFTGLTQNYTDTVLKGQINLGSRAAVPLPAGATAGLLQVQPNIMPMEAMKHKESQMVALGARLVEASSVARTATESLTDKASSASQLSNAADNVSSAYTTVLKFAARYTGDTGANAMRFSLNTEFDLQKLDANARVQLIREWQAEAITYSEMRRNLKRSGIASLTDADARAEVERDRVDFPPIALDVGGSGDKPAAPGGTPALPKPPADNPTHPKPPAA